MKSILQKVRYEAVKKERERRKLHDNQISFMNEDEIEERGRSTALAEAPRRWVWFSIGAAMGSLMPLWVML